MKLRSLLQNLINKLRLTCLKKLKLIFFFVVINMPRNCIVDSCKSRATYGFHLSTIYCLEHSTGEVKEFQSKEYKLCITNRCKQIATYGYINSEPVVCDKHSNSGLSKKKTYRNKANNKCIVKICEDLISLGFDNSTGLFCKNHFTTEPMIQIEPIAVLGMCVENKCAEYALYGTESAGQANLCAIHSSGNIKDINNKHLVCKDCDKRASFGYVGYSIEKCKDHIEEGMVDLNSTKCEHNGCLVQPTFGFTKAVRCRTHIIEGMIDLKSAKCEYSECESQAAYGYDFKIRCAKHRETDMSIVYKTQVCQHEGCDKFSGFNVEGDKRKYCFEHKKDHMINVINNFCSYDGCNILASFGYEPIRARERCTTHQLPNMIQLSQQMCNKCKEVTMNPKYRPHCYTCHAGLYPNSVKLVELRTKENAYIKPLKRLYPGSKSNKEIVKGVSRHRPDLLIEFDDRVIIVEIDEDQHSRIYSYDKDTEDRRNNCFIESIKKPIFMIRLNPDNYRSNGELVRGSFTYNSNKRLVAIEEEFIRRYEILLETVKKCESCPLNVFQTIKLFFNE